MMTELLKSCLIAVPGGVLFYFLHLPLPWMLGPLAAVTVYKTTTGNRLFWPVELRNAALIVLGYAIGRPFSLETGRQIAVQLPLMALVTMLTVLISLLMGYIIHKRAGVSLATGLLGSVPGGLSQMPVLAEEIEGADVTVVTFMQTARLLTVVFSVPFLATHGLAGDIALNHAVVSPIAGNGLPQAEQTMLLFGLIAVGSAFVARRIKLPTPYLLGPILATGMMTVSSGWEAPPLPALTIIVAQVFTGIYMGTSTNIASLQNWRVLLPQVLLGVVVVVLASLLAGYMLAYLGVSTLITGFLSTAPGGMAEMGLTAMLVHADISMIVAYQLFRLLVVLLFVPSLIRFVVKTVQPQRS